MGRLPIDLSWELGEGHRCWARTEHPYCPPPHGAHL